MLNVLNAVCVPLESDGDENSPIVLKTTGGENVYLTTQGAVALSSQLTSASVGWLKNAVEATC
jgi:hypothetical protein